MKSIDRRLLFHLVDVVWAEAHEDESVPSTEWARRMVQKAIELRRAEKYTKQKLNIAGVGGPASASVSEGEQLPAEGQAQNGRGGCYCQSASLQKDCDGLCVDADQYD